MANDDTIGNDLFTAVTIGGDPVTEITAGGDVVWTADTSVIIDSWEDQDWSEYNDTNPSGLSITQDFVTDGSYGARTDGSNAQNQTVQSVSGLNAYPQQGDEFKLDFQFSQSAANTSDAYYMRVFWALADSDNFMMMEIDCQFNGLELWEQVSGGYNLLADSNISWLANEEYTMVWQWDDGSTFGGSAGDYDIRAYDSSDTEVVQVTGNNTNTTNGGIQFQTVRQSSTENIFFDNFRITNR